MTDCTEVPYKLSLYCPELKTPGRIILSLRKRKEESVIIKIIVIILKENPWNVFDYSPKGA